MKEEGRKELNGLRVGRKSNLKANCHRWNIGFDATGIQPVGSFIFMSLGGIFQFDDAKETPI